MTFQPQKLHRSPIRSGALPWPVLPCILPVLGARRWLTLCVLQYIYIYIYTCTGNARKAGKTSLRTIKKTTLEWKSRTTHKKGKAENHSAAHTEGEKRKTIDTFFVFFISYCVSGEGMRWTLREIWIYRLTTLPAS